MENYRFSPHSIKITMLAIFLAIVSGCSSAKQNHVYHQEKEDDSRMGTEVFQSFDDAYRINYTNRRDSLRIARQYTAIEGASKLFLSHPSQKFFFDALDNFMVKNYQELSSTGTSKMELLMPVLIDKKETKAVVLGLNRILDKLGRRVDCVRFVSCKFNNGKWNFAFRPGYCYLICYDDERKTLLSEKEVAKRAVIHAMELRYWKDNAKASERLFQLVYYY